MAKQLMSLGKQLPPELMQQIMDDKKRDIEEDTYNKNTIITTSSFSRQPSQPSQYFSQNSNQRAYRRR